MTRQIFIDANIPVYAAGRAHPLKNPSLEVLKAVARMPEAFVTDAEVLQELLHRYLALRLWNSGGREAFRAFVDLMRERIEPVLIPDVEAAAALADVHGSISARDLLHAAVMNRLGTGEIASADADFDSLPGITRLDPTDAISWLRRFA